MPVFFNKEVHEVSRKRLLLLVLLSLSIVVEYGAIREDVVDVINDPFGFRIGLGGGFRIRHRLRFRLGGRFRIRHRLRLGLGGGIRRLLGGASLVGGLLGGLPALVGGLLRAAGLLIPLALRGVGRRLLRVVLVGDYLDRKSVV